MLRRLSDGLTFLLTSSLVFGTALPSSVWAKDAATVTKEQWLESPAKLEAPDALRPDALTADTQTDATAPAAPKIDDQRLSLDEFKAQLQRESTARKASTAPGDSPGLPGKELTTTLIATMIISFAQVIREATDDARLQNKTLSPQENWDLYKTTSKTLLQSEDFWMGILGGKMAEPVNYIIKTWATDSNLNVKVSGVLAGGVAQLVTQVGWILVAQAWKDAVLQQSAAAQSKAHGVAFRVFKKMLDPKLSPEDLKKDEDFVLLQGIVRSLTDILIANPEMRDDWIANAFRLQMTQGDTVLFTVATMTATAIGVAFIVPIGLPAFTTFVLCAGFGIEAGLITAALPQRLGDEITTATKSARGFFADTRLSINEANIRTHGARFHTGVVSEASPVPQLVVQLVQSRHDLRRDDMTARLEKYYDLSVKLQRAEKTITDAKTVIAHEQELADMPMLIDGKWSTLKDSQPAVCRPNCSTAYQLNAINESTKAIQDGQAVLEGMEMEMIDLYMHDVQVFSHHLEDSDEVAPLSVAQAYRFELKWTCLTGAQLGVLFGAMTPQFIQDLHLEKFDSNVTQYATDPTFKSTAQFHFNYAEFHRFKENIFLGSLGFSKQIIDDLPASFEQNCESIANEFQPNPEFN